ncbi:MAG: 8-amino-7-oxononanoate synthase [bacterium]|nr:8-amino-7-oxononanoate synthase [bacterium]
MDLDKILKEEIDGLKRANLYRTLKKVEGSIEPVILIDGREFINLSSNNYLGLTTHPRLIEASINATKRYGTGSGASRLISGNVELYEELEEKIAEFKGTESSVVFSTGYMANLGIIASLVESQDLVIIDKLSHASIIDGCRLSGGKLRVYPHKDLEKLERILRRGGNYRRRLIVTDGVFSMDGDIAPLPELLALAKKYEAFLMVDDAHSTGVLGKEGRGTLEYFGLEDKQIIQMGTLSKALGSLGGFVAASSILIDWIRNRARSLIYSTALPASVLATAISAIQVISSEPTLRGMLWKNVKSFKDGLVQLGYNIMDSQTQIVPILVGDTEKTIELAKYLYEEGIYAPPIRPPTVPKGQSRIRTSLMATHTESHIDKALSLLKKAGRKLGII